MRDFYQSKKYVPEKCQVVASIIQGQVVEMRPHDFFDDYTKDPTLPVGSLTTCIQMRWDEMRHVPLIEETHAMHCGRDYESIHYFHFEKWSDRQDLELLFVDDWRLRTELNSVAAVIQGSRWQGKSLLILNISTLQQSLL